MTNEFTLSGKASVIVDGQFGSTGKGLIAAYLAQKNPCYIATTNASANAGHTTVLADGTKFITYHLPTFGVINSDCHIYLNAGAIIDLDLLIREIEELRINPNRVFINPRAAIITDEDKKYERGVTSGTTKSGSTQKGVGRALARKIMREGMIAGNSGIVQKYFNIMDFNMTDVLRGGERVVVEIPQGYSLGINSGLNWPHCTSREVTVAQGLADAGIHPKFIGKTMMSVRTYPIRVGHIYDENGLKIGDSGPCYPDQVELSWEDIGVIPEITTVTKRIRRVFTWSDMQYRMAVRINQPDFVFLNFCNYLIGENHFKEYLHNMALYHPATHYGVGPSVSDVLESWQQVMEKAPWVQQMA